MSVDAIDPLYYELQALEYGESMDMINDNHIVTRISKNLYEISSGNSCHLTDFNGVINWINNDDVDILDSKEGGWTVAEGKQLEVIHYGNGTNRPANTASKIS